MSKQATKDKQFKDIVEDLLEQKSINFITSGYYTPDKMFVVNNHLFIMECSSTGDRKTIIGELFGAFVYFNFNKSTYKSCNLIIFLTGVYKSSPTKSLIEKYLAPYMDYIKSTGALFDLSVIDNVLGEDKKSLLSEKIEKEIGDKINSINLGA